MKKIPLFEQIVKRVHGKPQEYYIKDVLNNEGRFWHFVTFAFRVSFRRQEYPAFCLMSGYQKKKALNCERWKSMLKDRKNIKD